MQLGRRHHVVALLSALFVNALGLYLLMQINEHVRAPKRKAVIKARAIDFAPRKKKKRRRRRVRARVKQVRLKQPPLPVPNLPSSIQAPSLLLPDVQAAGLIRPVLDEQLAKSARVILSEEQVDEPPKPLRRVVPSYPPSAADRNISGWVQLKLLINRSGLVEQALVTGSSPRGVFDRAAREAIKRWVFSAAKYQGQSVSVWFRQRLVFNLQ